MKYWEHDIIVSSFRSHESLAGDNLCIVQSECFCKSDLNSFPPALSISHIGSIFDRCEFDIALSIISDSIVKAKATYSLWIQ
jgi:hypothetical protein